MPTFNARFTVLAAEELDFHQRLPKGVDLSLILSTRESRTVGEDWCVLYANRVFQLGRIHQGLGLAGRKITVVEKGGRQYNIAEWFPAAAMEGTGGSDTACGGQENRVRASGGVATTGGSSVA